MNKTSLKKKNVALVINAIPEIPNKAVYQRAIMLASNYDLHIYAKYDICDSIRNITQSVDICPGLKFSVYKVLFPFWVLFRIAKAKNITVVHTVFSYSQIILLTGYLCKLLGMVWIADILDDPALPLEAKRPGLIPRIGNLIQVAMYAVTKRVLKYSDLIIMLRGMKELLCDFDIDSHKILEVTNGVDLSHMEKSLLMTDRRDAAKSNQPLKIVYIGHVTIQRGMLTVIEAAHLISEKVDFELFLVGPCNQDDLSLILKKIEDYDLKSRVKIVGLLPHDKTMEIVRSADICLYPFPRTRQLEYVSPIKVFEYLAFGKVVIASNLKGVDGIIKDKINGFLVTPENSKELADRIEQIYQNPEMRMSIERNALQTIRMFDWRLINEEITKSIDLVFNKNTA